MSWEGWQPQSWDDNRSRGNEGGWNEGGRNWNWNEGGWNEFWWEELERRRELALERRWEELAPSQSHGRIPVAPQQRRTTTGSDLQYAAPAPAAVAEPAPKAPPPAATTSPAAAPAAVAEPAPAAPPPAPAPAAPPPPPQAVKVYDLEFFRSYRNFTAKWPQHSAALKFFRKKLQQDGLNELMFDGTEEIARIIHPAGTAYHFDESVMFHWDWVGMIAQLADESLVTLLQSQDGANRSRGIVACGIKMMPRYSHQLQCAQGVRGGPVQHVWDFVLEHEDGSTTSLHPQWSKTKVACTFAESPVDFEVPRSGPGGTSGRGTFNQFKNKHIDQ